jgi:hypothetical protein
MPDANSVTAALEEVLADDTTESQAVTPDDTDVAAALKEVISPTGDDSTLEDDSETSAKDEGKGSKTVPYERLSKVVQQKNDLSERYTALEEKFKSATQSNEQLQGKVETLQNDAEMLDAIKNLAKDERYHDAVVKIDKALQGHHDDVAEAKETGDPVAINEAEKRFDAKVAELEAMQADQRAEGLWREAAGHAKDMLAALPEEYTDADRDRIGKLWTPRVDWNGIEESGSESIPSALNSSLAAVIKEYGTPQGALVAQTTKEIESRIPESKLVSNEDRIAELTETDWAARNEDGNAVISDDEFNNGIAEMLRRTREG